MRLNRQNQGENKGRRTKTQPWGREGRLLLIWKGQEVPQKAERQHKLVAEEDFDR